MHGTGDEQLNLDKDIARRPAALCRILSIRYLLTGNLPEVICQWGLATTKENKKYRACVAFIGRSVKLGRFNPEEKAFARYKEYKED